MKTFTRLLLALLLTFGACLDSFAQEFEVDGIRYRRIDDGYDGYEVIDKYPEKYSGDITIPASITILDEFMGWYDDFPVVRIRKGSFSDCHNLTSITLPNSLTTIGESAFENCCNLTSITLPNSVTTIGQYAFLGCYNLELTTLPNSLTTIGKQAFAFCYPIKSVIIPNSVTEIGDGAFEGCI